MTQLASFNGGDGVTGFDVAPITELAMKTDLGIRALFSLAAFSQPAGGNARIDVE